MQRAASPRLAARSTTYVGLTSRRWSAWRCPLHAARWGGIRAPGRVVTHARRPWVSFVVISVNLWPIRWPLYAKASPSSRRAAAASCPRRPVASRGSKASGEEPEPRNHGVFGQEDVVSRTLVKWSLNKYPRSHMLHQDTIIYPAVRIKTHSVALDRRCSLKTLVF